MAMCAQKIPYNWSTFISFTSFCWCIQVYLWFSPLAAHVYPSKQVCFLWKLLWAVIDMQHKMYLLKSIACNCDFLLHCLYEFFFFGNYHEWWTHFKINIVQYTGCILIARVSIQLPQIWQAQTSVKVHLLL